MNPIGKTNEVKLQGSSHPGGHKSREASGWRLGMVSNSGEDPTYILYIEEAGDIFRGYQQTFRWLQGERAHT